MLNRKAQRYFKVSQACGACSLSYFLLAIGDLLSCHSSWIVASFPLYLRVFFSQAASIWNLNSSCIFSHTATIHTKYMILITQVLRPGQFKLHREAARRLWKLLLCSLLLCSQHCSITSILHFAGQLLHISWRVDLRAIADTFPGVGGCSVACVLGDVNARRWREDLPWNQEKQEVLCKKWQTYVCVGNQMLRFFYLPGSCDVNCRVSTVRRGAQRPIWICTARNLRRSG